MSRRPRVRDLGVRCQGVRHARMDAFGNPIEGSGRRCRNFTQDESGLCAVHRKQQERIARLALVEREAV